MSRLKQLAGYPSQKAAILAYHARGIYEVDIAATLELPINRVRARIYEAGLRPNAPRQRRSKGYAGPAPAKAAGCLVERPTVVDSLLDLLRQHAARRGVDPAVLTSRIIDAVNRDGLIDAVLDGRSRLVPAPAPLPAPPVPGPTRSQLAAVVAERDELAERLRQAEEERKAHLDGVPEWIGDARLPRIERRVLDVLLRRQLVTKAAIMSATSDNPDDDRDTKLADVLICKLRPKLASIGVEIRTHWGEGFSIPDPQRRDLRRMFGYGAGSR